MMCYPINVLINTDRMPEIEIGENLRKWMKAVEARPAFQRAKARLEEEERKAKDASPGTVS
jgi:glutathione S-transferase